jgi:hypothetical protein
LEEEYREEVRNYMKEMEVSRLSRSRALCCHASVLNASFSLLFLFSALSSTPCARLRLWTSSRRSSGTCVLAWSSS